MCVSVCVYVLAGCSAELSPNPLVVVAFMFLLGLMLRVMDRSSVLRVSGELDECGPKEYSDKSAAPLEDTEPRKSRSPLSTRRRELVLRADPLEINKWDKSWEKEVRCIFEERKCWVGFSCRVCCGSFYNLSEF